MSEETMIHSVTETQPWLGLTFAKEIPSSFMTVLSAPAQHQLLYFGFSIHQEVASDPFCLLINSSWLLVFILFLFHHALALNLYWWKGIHFS